MKPLRYELHCHSCASPCGDNAMTPAFLCGMARLAGIELLAVTDHNCAENLPAAEEACRAYGLTLLPGLEATTAEEIHLLCYFPTVEAARELGRQIYEALPDVPCDTRFFGDQLVMNADDEVLARPEKLLLNACSFDLYELKRRVEALGGLTVPAHLDKETTSLLSVLGLMPEDITFPCVEFHDPARAAGFVAQGRMPAGLELLTSSDAHTPEALGTAGGLLAEPEKSFLWPLLRQRLM